MARGAKADYVQLGVRVRPEVHMDLKAYYPQHGMINKVIRVLLDRHLAKLKV